MTRVEGFREAVICIILCISMYSTMLLRLQRLDREVGSRYLFADCVLHWRGGCRHGAQCSSGSRNRTQRAQSCAKEGHSFCRKSKCLAVDLVCLVDAMVYRVNVGDGEKDTIVRGFWRRICGLFTEQIRKRWLYLIKL